MPRLPIAALPALAALVTSVAPAAADPPANDLCGNAAVLPAFGEVPGTTIGATADDVAPCDGAGPAAGAGVWYRYTVPEFGFETMIHLCWSTLAWDSRISVYQAGPCGGLVCLGGDNDDCPGGNHAYVFQDFGNGAELLLLVHGVGDAAGDFTLFIATGDALVDCNVNGLPDGQEIEHSPRLDCFNPAVFASPGVTGGPDGMLDACQCAGNFNRDFAVNSLDVSAFLHGWLTSVQAGNTNGDIDCSGATNSSDISAFLTRWLTNLQDQHYFDGCP